MEKDLVFAACSVVKEMAAQKAMTAEDIVDAVSTIAGGLNSIAMGVPAPIEQPTLGQGIIDPKKAIKEKSITCLECGKSLKVLTKKHLAAHGLTPEQYREKYCLKKGTALCAKALVRERRKKMQDMKLWERRGKPATEAQQ